ncbi:hypothetical protein BH09BAC6_BH09BAC6_25480 [soil metagenome]|jgi:hypothetical protein
MKKLVLTALIFIAFAKLAIAQQAFSAVDFTKRLGKTGTLCDTVYSLRVVSDTLALLNMGGAYPNQKYTVAVKGNKVVLDWTHLKGKSICVTGVFELYKERPEIVVAQPGQVDVH